MTRALDLKSKICLVGDVAVGKTALVQRFVHDGFDDRYVMTLGARTSKKVVEVPLAGTHGVARVEMIVWDIMGQLGFRELLKEAYFHGSRGILAVADVTRRWTLDGLSDWIDRVERVAGRVPVLIAVNKSDLVDAAELDQDEAMRFAEAHRSEVVMTSAKSGTNVEEAFRRLGTAVARRQLSLAPE